MEETKTCTRCAEAKPATRDFFNQHGGGRLRAICKACHSAEAKRYYHANREKVLARLSRQYSENSEAKLLTNRRYRETNHPKVKAAKRRYYDQNRDRVLSKNRHYRALNWERLRASERVRREATYDDFRARMRRWYAARKEWDRRLAVNMNIASRMRAALRTRKAGRKWEVLAGYTLSEIMVHLERQFSRGMSWKNYGKLWHIDHIVPVAAFAFESADDVQFRACWALTNLRPLWKRDNLRKHAKRLHLL